MLRVHIWNVTFHYSSFRLLSIKIVWNGHCKGREQQMRMLHSVFPPFEKQLLVFYITNTHSYMRRISWIRECVLFGCDASAKLLKELHIWTPFIGILLMTDREFHFFISFFSSTTHFFSLFLDLTVLILWVDKFLQFDWTNRVLRSARLMQRLCYLKYHIGG